MSPIQEGKRERNQSKKTDIDAFGLSLSDAVNQAYEQTEKFSSALNYFILWPLGAPAERRNIKRLFTNTAGQLQRYAHFLEARIRRRRCSMEVEQRRDWGVDCCLLFEAGKRRGEE